MLSTLDNKIQAISTQAAASKQRLEEHDQIVQQNLKELMEKQKEKGGIVRNAMEGRDVLTLLLKANMATDIPDNQRLSYEDVLARMWLLHIS